MKTLVVDDDPISRLVLEDSLARFGTVASCADGAEAVAEARRALELNDPYDLICMDLVMPTMSGLEALRLVREEEARRSRPRAAKVVVITSREDSGSIHEAFQQLCDAYVVKPVDTEALLNIVECICQVARNA